MDSGLLVLFVAALVYFISPIPPFVAPWLPGITGLKGSAVFVPLAIGFGLFVIQSLLTRWRAVNISERRGQGSVAWGLPLSARFMAACTAPAFLLLAYIMTGFVMGALQVGDWSRMALGALTIGAAAALLVRNLWRAVAGQRLLAIDQQGIRAPKLPGGRLRWAGLDRVTFKSDPKSFDVGLAPVDGPVIWLNIRETGLTSREFGHILKDTVPSVTTDDPRNRFADLAAD